MTTRFRGAVFTSSSGVFFPWRPLSYMLQRLSKMPLREDGSIAARFLSRAVVRLFCLHVQSLAVKFVVNQHVAFFNNFVREHVVQFFPIVAETDQRFFIPFLKFRFDRRNCLRVRS